MNCNAQIGFPTCPRSCADVPTAVDRVIANPGITAKMTAETLVLSVPPGSLLFVDYSAGGPTSERAHEEASTALEAGMAPSHFVGHLIGATRARGAGGSYVIFRLVCLNRGEPGNPQVRTFSTRRGTLHGARLLSLPEHRPAVAAA